MTSTEALNAALLDRGRAWSPSPVGEGLRKAPGFTFTMGFAEKREGMRPPTRHAPLTPLDALRGLLRESSEGDAAFQNRLVQSVQALKRQSLAVLGPALRQPASSRALRRMILQLAVRFDWPEWAPHLRQALLQETDLGIFDEGCAALGALGTREAWEALEALQAARGDADRQVILDRERNLLQSPQGVAHHLGRLQEGAGNPRLAQQGARHLAVLAGEEDFPAIRDAFLVGDEVAQRLALRILGGVPGEGVTAFLAGLLDHARRELLDAQELQALLRRTESVPRASARETFLALVVERFRERVPQEAQDLRHLAVQENLDPVALLEPFRAEGSTETFLLEALGLLLESKVARYSAFHSETLAANEGRLVQLTDRIEQVSERLAYRVDLGLAQPGEVLRVLTEVFHDRLGGDAFLFAFLRLVPPADASILEAVLAEPEVSRRQKCLDALGTREDDALTPFFLKATLDPIVEVGHLAMHHLGKLPGSLPALMALFESGQPDQMRRAIRAFAENHTAEAAEPLLAFVQKDLRDDLLVEAVDALANLGVERAAEPLLNLLHDGKPLALQVSLARALGMLGTEEASLGLIHKAPQLKHPQVLVLCLEGALSAFMSFDQPLPVAELPSLLQLVDRCCDEREGEGQRLRAVLAMQNLYVLERDAYERLKDRFSDFLFDMRAKESWDRESNDRVAAVVKEMARRSENLAQLAQREADLRSRLAKLPPEGPRRVEAMLQLRDALGAPGLILRPELGRTLGGLVREGLLRDGSEWREVALLCEIGGLSRQAELVEPIRDVFLRASGLGLKSAAREALSQLGLSESDLNRRPPIRSILVLEPSAFFRKRVLAALASAGDWEIREAGSRGEAEERLGATPADLIVSEIQDGEGDLAPWLEIQYGRGRIRGLVLSTATRDLGSLEGQPWLVATCFKPYPMEQLLQGLQA